MAKNGLTVNTRQVERELDKYIKKTDRESKRAMFIAIKKGESLAKVRVPVDKGRLRSSIQGNVDEDKDGLLGILSANTNYAAYVEFGTGNKFSLIDSEVQGPIARDFIGAGLRQVNLPARPYLYPSILDASKNFVRAIKKIYK